MAVQPLNKTKIIKKQKKHPNRFASDKYKRVGVSLASSVIPSPFRLEILENSPRYRFAHPSSVPRQPGPADDRQRAGEEDPPRAVEWIQKIAVAQCPGHRAAPHEQPHLRRRDRQLRLRQDQVSAFRPHLRRKAIVQRAKELNVRLTNGTAKLKKQSNE